MCLQFSAQWLYANGDKNASDNITTEILKQNLLELEKESYKITTIFKKIVQLVSPSVVKIKMKNEVGIVEKNEVEDKGNIQLPHQGEDQMRPQNDRNFNLYNTFELPDRYVGSGFFVDESGIIVTNYHVIKDFKEKQIEVTLYNNEKYKGKIIGFDLDVDLAVLKIEGNKFQPVLFGDDRKTEIGDWVMAIGNPYGYQQAISTGIISATVRKHTQSFPHRLTYEDFIQTDVSINPGCSGGPLVNMLGEVIGINTAIATRRGSFQGIGFTIPSSIIKMVIKELIDNDKIKNRGDVEAQRKD